MNTGQPTRRKARGEERLAFALAMLLACAIPLPSASQNYTPNMAISGASPPSPAAMAEETGGSRIARAEIRPFWYFGPALWTHSENTSGNRYFVSWLSPSYPRSGPSPQWGPDEPARAPPAPSGL